MHTIRLRGPWQLEPLERYVPGGDGCYERSTDGLPPGARATMPADWSESFGCGFLGRVRYCRTFQRPTGLEAGERVWLVIEPPRSRGTVILSDEPLGEVSWGGPPLRCDITDRLEDHNRLEITVDHPPLDAAAARNDDSSIETAGGLVGEVRLEIEE